MFLSLKSRSSGNCPVCGNTIGITANDIELMETAQTISNPVCTGCGTELEVTFKGYSLYVGTSLVLGFAIAYVQKLKGPVLVFAFIVYSLIALLGFGYLVLPFMPLSFKPIRKHVQTLQIDKNGNKVDHTD